MTACGELACACSPLRVAEASVAEATRTSIPPSACLLSYLYVSAKTFHNPIPPFPDHGLS